MNKLHLNYDRNQTNGIIFNDKYLNGALYLGAEHKPKLSFDFDDMQYSEVFDNPNYVEFEGVKRVMTNAEGVEVAQMASEWIQPLGQEGNPTDAQKQEAKNNEAKAYLQSTDWYYARKMETDIEVPQAIVDKRVLARESIIDTGV